MDTAIPVMFWTSVIINCSLSTGIGPINMKTA